MYVGEFLNDLYHGEGILTMFNGKKKKGLFKEHLFIKSN